MIFSLFISCAKGLEYLLAEELQGLGLTVTKVSPQGVYGEANLSTIYTLALWSRLANRILLLLFSGEALNQRMLYELCYEFDWLSVFSETNSLAIDFYGTSDEIRNTMFGAQVVKDAIVDKIRKSGAERPYIDKFNPQIRIHAHLKQNELIVSLDLVGFSLHQRGYRLNTGIAPLKENIAAAMLMRAKWPQLTAEGYDFYDPFCGSGTLVIEAAMIAANIAPGIIRKEKAFRYWLKHDESLWLSLCDQAMEQRKPVTIKINGSDIDERVISLAIANAARADVLNLVEFKSLAVKDIEASSQKGLISCNPPYGERLDDDKDLAEVYRQLGRSLHEKFQGWDATVLTSDPSLARAVGLRAKKQYTLFNGPLECKLYCITLDESNKLSDGKHTLGENALMFANRLKKNFTHLQKWAKRNNIKCYRVYDNDLPEYAFAIDIYHNYAVVQEYKAPASIPIATASRRCQDAMQIVPMVLGLSTNNVTLKQRKKQKGTDQYHKFAYDKQFIIVEEGQAKLRVNLHDYLDTGLFLDHRILRLSFANLPPTIKFLNCFCYTATASVHAALAGALTTNVDLSNTYLNWAEENFKLNNIDLSRHQFIQYDCLQWLNLTRDKFDVIFLDPPSFSNSKRMDATLDIQRDHEELINAAMRLLNPNGRLYFSTNLLKFKLMPEINERFKVKDITSETIDLDFKRDSKIHQCFLITSF